MFEETTGDKPPGETGGRRHGGSIGDHSHPGTDAESLAAEEVIADPGNGLYHGLGFLGFLNLLDLHLHLITLCHGVAPTLVPIRRPVKFPSLSCQMVTA